MILQDIIGTKGAVYLLLVLVMPGLFPLEQHQYNAGQLWKPAQSVVVSSSLGQIFTLHMLTLAHVSQRLPVLRSIHQ